jgi:hypothetical protein
MAYTRYTSNPAQMISIMIGSEFISPSTHALAKDHVSERHREKQNRYRKKNRILHRTFPQP